MPKYGCIRRSRWFAAWYKKKRKIRMIWLRLSWGACFLGFFSYLGELHRKVKSQAFESLWSFIIATMDVSILQLVTRKDKQLLFPMIAFYSNSLFKLGSVQLAKTHSSIKIRPALGNSVWRSLFTQWEKKGARNRAEKKRVISKK
ncbi:uncharacterized protein BYT42DRAFT_580839 [Radiomyces spectabilis]|uniref:uncharacterized protein n=1 Tax=Radiomyces spectabilis TaxID=64574 RepID=UPI002220632E|nr:uncharacterized protein BYT42DRAFT_580839 [Radiomyces spectabilis]KAI8371604.1 hypothetical protein BYT42DRAFT_580839 [Radiomyces spectabilis]